MAVVISMLANNANRSSSCSRKPGKQAPRGQLLRPCVKHRPAAAGATDSRGDEASQQGPSPAPAGQAMAPEVLEALQRVQEAVVEAEQTLEKLESLPSAREPTQWDALLAAAKPLVQALALGAAGMLTHSFGKVVQVGGSLLLGLALGLVGYRRGSLALSGAMAAAAVGWGTLGSSFRAGLTLLTFFFTSSKLTQLGDEEKAVDEEHKAGGQRDWKQVVCNALVPTILSILAARHTGAADVPLGVGSSGRLVTGLLGAFLGYYACCCGDTWASELGQLSTEEPRLITTLRPVRKGTNGGVTLVGLAASLAGGLCMGLTFFLAAVVSPTGPGRAVALQQWRLVPLGLAAGLVGSIIDSILGATIQFTGYNLKTGKITGKPGPEVAPISGLPVLDNNLVNVVSASCTALLAGLASTRLFV